VVDGVGVSVPTTSVPTPAAEPAVWSNWVATLGSMTAPSASTSTARIVAGSGVPVPPEAVSAAARLRGTSTNVAPRATGAACRVTGTR
jgi:hypothetical protein